MATSEINSFKKWKYTLYTSFVLLILFNPFTYQFVNSLLAKFIGNIASPNGCPTLLGFTLHLILFTIIIRYIMDLHI